MIEKVLRIKAGPATVYAHLVDPIRIVTWLGQAVEADPVPGGDLMIRYENGDTMRGQFVELVPDKRVVYTWGWDDESRAVPPGSTTVEFDLERDGDDTVLTLRHQGLEGEWIERHDQGWDHFLAQLSEKVATPPTP